MIIDVIKFCRALFISQTALINNVYTNVGQNIWLNIFSEQYSFLLNFLFIF